MSPVTVWTIYCGPNDHPGRWVLRAYDVFPGRQVRANSFCYIAKTLDEARAKVPPGTRCMGRNTADHPVIHESWIGEPAGLRRH